MEQSKVITADQISLRYRYQPEDRRTLKWAFLQVFRREERQDFWALSDISFTMKAGESWGIIGVNGSGKSTLLKLLTGILRPDRGRLTVSGNVSALLELGAGFQPDLTGRENIYLNGSLLGLSRRQIREKVETIIDFSGIRQFIDTPVKHYSSGMYMRLGFSIAVNVDPDILLIDEVFAVGDLKFQEKCMDRIKEFKARNKTILLVSHDMNAIRSLCDSAIWLHQGQVMKCGPTTEVIDFYKNHLAEQGDLSLETVAEGADNRWGTGRVKIVEVILKQPGNEATRTFHHGGPFQCIIRYRAEQPVKDPVFGLAIHRNDGIHLTGPNTRLNGLTIDTIQGEGQIVYTVDRLPLLAGKYLLSAVVYDSSCVVPYDHIDRAYPFRVTEDDCPELYGLVSLGGTWTGPEPGPDQGGEE